MLSLGLLNKKSTFLHKTEKMSENIQLIENFVNKGAAPNVAHQNLSITLKHNTLKS